MQTLGLQGESKRSDGRLKSIFWPAVENAWDVDYLGRQGFCICTIVALLQVAIAVLSGHPVYRAVGVIEALIFFIGGMGVRQASWPAAALLFAIFFLNLLTTIAQGGLPNVLTIIVAGILLSNVRAAFLASEWKPAAPEDDQPTRFSETLGDKIIDQLPAKLWPVLQIPFFGLAAILLLFTLLGAGAIALQRFGFLPHTVPRQP